MPSWPILSALSDEDAHGLLALARRRTYGRGEVVFHRDDPSDTLHLVSSGCFAVRVSTRLGDVSTLSLVGPGQCFGELALIRPEHLRTATVQALEPGETHTLSRVEFDRRRRERPALDAFLVELLAARVAELTERLVEALYTPAPQRVRLVLDELCRRYRDESGTAAIPLTQDDLAGLAGTSRLTVSRVLRGLKQQGSVEVRRGRINVRSDAV
ncbi:MAG TPA: Crp/Fnr family transcriptional regulator [Gaiellales bacterium]|jgi:CRP-like cAMP-binding protein|nr:Crp/Fnr family transcriptional regulator [Gaiellales bacterium]